MYYNYFPTKKFQIYQIFSSNTNLGKTIFSTGLIRASIIKSQRNKNHYYLKPIQTGYPKDDDLRFVKTYLPEKFNNLIKLESLYKYEKAVSSHLATNNPIPKDEDVLNKIKGTISESYNESLKDGGRLFLETAGGVNSPIMSGTIQSEFYRALRLPIVLVGDSNLGGISTTISSYESLTLRGYDIPTLLLFNNERYNNHLFIEKYFNENQNSSIITPKIFTISLPPPKAENDLSDVKELKAYFDSNDEKFQAIISTLEEWHDNRFSRLDEMEEKAKEMVWWPFTQHNIVDGVNVIDSAYKDLLISYKDDSNLVETFDGSASWWTQGLGHGNSKLSLTASYASGRYGHILFPESIHEPSLSLSESLLDGVGKNWANRVFYSDNGSTAMEVALKMALTEKQPGDGKELLILGLEGSYHGDTIGVMNASIPSIYNKRVNWYSPKGVWFSPPQILMKDNTYRIFTNGDEVGRFDSLSEIFSESRVEKDRLSYHYKQKIEKQILDHLNQGDQFGALIMEPIVMGAGGMIFVDPLYQNQLIKSVRSMLNIPIIFDEVFTGFWRLGRQSGAEYLNVNPDIAAYAKLLTGGLCPLAVTLTNEQIFDKFLGNTKVDALLHGHSYTAHPIGCLVANTSINEYIDLFKNVWNKSREEWGDSDNEIFSVWSKSSVKKLSCLPNVNGVFALGTILSIELNDKSGGGYGSNVAKLFTEKLSHVERNSIDDFGIKTRPLGNVVYIMSSLISDEKSIRNIEKKIINCLSE